MIRSPAARRLVLRGVATPKMAMTLPFIAAMLALTSYLLPLFHASGELLCGCPHVHVPRATQSADLEPAPILEIGPLGVFLNGFPEADDPHLVDDLLILRTNFTLLHPDEVASGRILINADRTTPFRRIAAALRVARGVGFDAPDYVIEIVM